MCVCVCVCVCLPCVSPSQYIVSLIHLNGLAPRRTVRAVLFVDEEICQSGASAYAVAHRHENIVAAIETDMGVVCAVWSWWWLG